MRHNAAGLGRPALAGSQSFVFNILLDHSQLAAVTRRGGLAKENDR
jgi:hypothetical protein